MKKLYAAKFHTSVMVGSHEITFANGETDYEIKLDEKTMIIHIRHTRKEKHLWTSVPTVNASWWREQPKNQVPAEIQASIESSEAPSTMAMMMPHLRESAAFNEAAAPATPSAQPAPVRRRKGIAEANV